MRIREEEFDKLYDMAEKVASLRQNAGRKAISNYPTIEQLMKNKVEENIEKYYKFLVYLDENHPSKETEETIAAEKYIRHILTKKLDVI